MRPQRKTRAFTIYELLAVAAVLAVIGAILFLALMSGRRTSKRELSARNCNQVGTASLLYSASYDEMIIPTLNGRNRDLRNVRDGQLTEYHEQRTDTWALILVPYLKSRSVLIDPGRGDLDHIYDGPPKAEGDPGFVATGGTYRNQNRDPMYGLNYLFLSPVRIPEKHMTEDIPIDFAQGAPYSLHQAEKPAETVMFTESQNDVGSARRGSWVIDAPGIYQQIARYDKADIVYTGYGPCSASWCHDIDPEKPGDQKSTAQIYTGYENGSNVTWMDGHTSYMKDVALAAGTNFPIAVPQDFGVGEELPRGGAVIIDKSAYLWNLNGNYYGA